MKYFSKVFIVLILLVFIACRPDINKKQGNSEYYDLASFINKQVDILSRQDITVKKEIIKGNQKQTKNIKVENWQKELYFFLQADINNPSLEGEYNIKKETIGQNEKITYKAKKDKFKVKLLEVLLDKKQQKPYKLKAILKNDNFVYDSDLEISLECAMRGDVWQIVNYNIKADQKIIMGKAQNYKVKAKVIRE